MIDPIHNQAYQEYTKVTRQKSIQTNEKFSMDSSMSRNLFDQDSDGVIYEPDKKENTEEKKTTATNAGKNHSSYSTSPKEQDSVTLSTHKIERTAEASPSITDSIRRLFQHMLTALKKVLAVIWETKPAPATNPEENSSEDATSNADVIDSEDLADKTKGNIDDDFLMDFEQTLSTIPDPKKPSELDQNIKKALKAGDTDTFKALISNDGRRVPARSTSLLTYYDSKGRIITPDPSAQHRILHGDRGSQKS